MLEQISEYNVLAHVLKDIQCGLDQQSTVGSALEGINGTLRTGEAIPAPANAGPPITPSTRVFAIRLLSGLIGGLQDKYVLVGDMVGDLRLESTLAATTDPFTSTSALDWRVDQMELMLEYVELSDSATAMVTQQNRGG